MAIDGVLNESIWSTAPAIGDLLQRQPDEGRPPTERTTVQVLRDVDNLYIGIHSFDSEPGRIVGNVMARDASLESDDRIEIVLDTFRDQRTAFYFATNAVGAMVDGLVFANGQLNTEWDAIWNARTQRTDNGWVAEFAIPFKSLSFPANQEVWGFNISRTIARKVEDNRWSGARLQTPFLQMSEAGEIRNLGALTQGVGLDLRPFMAGRWLHSGQADRVSDFDPKPGLDLFYNLSPSMRLTATFNTDFGETEVDSRQINLTRFSLFFPEKRAFFLEGAGVFSFESTGPDTPGGVPGIDADIYPFFSRQIGLLGGREVPIQAGVKLIGTAGRTEIGILDVRAGDLEEGNMLVVDGKNFFVGRIKRNLLEQSYIGAIFTDGHPSSGQSGQTYGADIRLATSRFLGGQRNFIVNGYVTRSVNQGIDGKDWSYGASASYPNDKYVAQASIKEIQENFDPALGFVQRSNVRVIAAGASYNPRPRFFNILQSNHDVYFKQFTRLDHNEIESWDVAIRWFGADYRNGDATFGIFDVNPTFERLFEPFEISPGVILRPGEYRFTRFRLSPYRGAERRRVSGVATVHFGDYWSGKAERVTTSLAFRLPPWFTASFDTNQTFARLPEGNFIARILTSNFDYAVSPRLSFTNLVQYDNRSRNLGWQSRARWTLRPGNDLFVAFQQGWIQEDEGLDRGRKFTAQDTKLSAKFQYSHRF
jgi:hypothetical protein